MWSAIAAQKSDSLKGLIARLDTGEEKSWITAFAPVIWWHPDEAFKSTDPQELLASAHIWYREINKYFPFIDDELKDFGPFEPTKLRSITHNEFTPVDDVTRLMETGGIKRGYAGFEMRYDAFATPKLPAPLFWRISRHPLFKLIQPQEPHRALVPIEYWYHFNYNDTRWHFGNHDGDWESVLFVIEISDVSGKVFSKPIAVSTSAHGGSSWHCEKKLNHSDGRVELYNALGTHATYSETGNHWRLIYPDQAEKGDAWQSWKLVRPIEKESFYGFSGSWGSTSYVYFQNAPIPPGPHFKYLPADTNVEQSVADFKNILRECSLN